MSTCDKYEESKKAITSKINFSMVKGPTEDEWRHFVNLYLECQLEGIIGPRDPDGVFSAIAHDLVVDTLPELIRQQIKVLRQENSSTDPAQSHINLAADPVMMFNGQFVHEVTDITINGAGMDFAFMRTYKNQVAFDGPLGFNWTHNFHIWLRVANETIFRATGDLREEVFTRHPRFGQASSDDFNYWIPSDGKDGVIFARGDSFVLRMPNGVSQIFEQDPSHSFLHRLKEIQDRHGNFLLLDYSDTDGLLSQISVNHPLRVITFQYDEQGRIRLIQDYMGRQWQYAYDSIGDLIAVTSPATDRYKQGLTVCYDYSTAFHTGELRHNLIRIIDAAGHIYLENEYGTEPGLLDFNRVVRQRQGGGEFRFEYEDIDQVLDFDYPDEQRPMHQAILIERNGQPVRHIYNKFGNLLRRDQMILRDGLPQQLVEHYRYNLDGNVVASLSPEGVLTQHLYGRDYFVRRHGLTPNGEIPTDALTWRERQAFGRIRATVCRDGYAVFPSFSLTQGVFGNFPDVIDGIFPPGMGKREDDIIVKFTYEDEFGQIKTVSDPRFTNSPDPDALNEHPRHQETLTEYFYDVLVPNDPPNRFLVSIKRATPTLPNGDPGELVMEKFSQPDPNDPTQERPAYDSHGRLLRHTNALGMVTENKYFPTDSNDPLKEGYLQETVVDQGGLHITIRYEVDSLGRFIAVRLPRSVEVADDRFVTHTRYNELDQVTETRSSKPFEFRTRRFYDRNGKIEREEGEIKNENGQQILGDVWVHTYCYDEEFNLIQETMGGRELSEHLVTRHRYNSAGQRAQTILPQGNQVLFAYDERMLQVNQTWAACSDEEAITRTEYDGDGRVRCTFDARGNPTTFELDAFGRVISKENALGHITRMTYDKAGNITCTRVFEQRTDGYYLLARSETRYDELNRAIHSGVNRFDEPLGPLERDELETQFLQSPGPKSLLVTQTFYDAQNRVRRTIDPLGRETTFGYDNVDRLIAQTDPLGNRTENRYDAHGNLVRRDQIDLVRDPVNNTVVAQRVFSSSSTFDELDRMVSSTDSLGNITRYFYDSRGNQVKRVDPLGNVVRMDYDIFNRMVATHRDFTDTGLGGGVMQAVATTEHGYDRNGNLVGVVDARGRRTRYRYDTQDRRRAIIYPDESEMLYDYDLDSNLIRTVDNNGLQRLITVDALGRTTRVDVDKSGLKAKTTVEGATFESNDYDGLDRTIREENDFARCETRYNSLGWPLAETMNFTTPDAPLTQPLVIIREFNDVGALTGLTYPNGRRVQLDRDELDRLTRVQNSSNGSDYPGSAATLDHHDIVTRIEYLGRQRGRCVYGNGSTISHTHDGAGRLIEIAHASPTAPLLTIQYLFDAVGNMRLRHDISPTRDVAEKFAYDSFYRLAHEAIENRTAFSSISFAPGSTIPPDPIPNRQADLDSLIGSLVLPPNNHTFEYDLVGNRESEQLADGSQVDYMLNELDQYESRNGVVFAYDRNGNMKSDGRREYIYDSRNWLVRATISASNQDIRFFHDARGRRILELANGTATHLIWDGDDQIAEYRDGIPFALYVFDDGIDRPLQIAADGTEHWYHADLVSSVRLLSDQEGNERTRYRYSSFGLMVETDDDSVHNPLRYTARRLDTTTKSYDYRSRQYESLLGRFLQRDPKEMIDSTHIYSYTQNNPLSFLDPNGSDREPPSSIIWFQTGDGLRAIEEDYATPWGSVRNMLEVFGHKIVDNPISDVIIAPSPGAIAPFVNPYASQNKGRSITRQFGETISEMIIGKMPPSLITPYLRRPNDFEFRGRQGREALEAQANRITWQWNQVGSRHLMFWIDNALSAASLPSEVSANLGPALTSFKRASRQPYTIGIKSSVYSSNNLGTKNTSRNFSLLIEAGEIKSIKSYKKGLHQLAQRKASGPTALVTYDYQGNVTLQVFTENSHGVRTITFESDIGKVGNLPSSRAGTVQFGNEIEPQVRGLVEQFTGQRFSSKRSNAGGPDLRP